jgi:hypothetical protein
MSAFGMQLRVQSRERIVTPETSLQADSEIAQEQGNINFPLPRIMAAE